MYNQFKRPVPPKTDTDFFLLLSLIANQENVGKIPVNRYHANTQERVLMLAQISSVAVFIHGQVDGISCDCCVSPRWPCVLSGNFELVEMSLQFSLMLSLALIVYISIFPMSIRCIWTFFFSFHPFITFWIFSSNSIMTL